MKINIHSGGLLTIERKGVTKYQNCPYANRLTLPTSGQILEQACGDWCPMFGEPVINKNGGFDTLKLCNVELMGKIEDAR